MLQRETRRTENRIYMPYDLMQLFSAAGFVDVQLFGSAAGEPFDSLASRFNTDPTTDAFGDLGWLKVSDLPQFFRDVLSGMNAGDVSQVLRESSGFRIVKLVENEVRELLRSSEDEDLRREALRTACR